MKHTKGREKGWGSRLLPAGGELDMESLLSVRQLQDLGVEDEPLGDHLYRWLAARLGYNRLPDLTVHSSIVLGAGERSLRSHLFYELQDDDVPRRLTVALAAGPGGRAIHERVIDILCFIDRKDGKTEDANFPLALVSVLPRVDVDLAREPDSVTEVHMDGVGQLVSKRHVVDLVRSSRDARLCDFLAMVNIDPVIDSLPLRVHDRGAGMLDVVPLSDLRAYAMVVPLRFPRTHLAAANLCIVHDSTY